MVPSIRNYAGGVVFCEHDVFLLMDDRGEWSMPKGVIRNRHRSNTVALWRVEDETGIHAEIVGIAGNTVDDFFSEEREKDLVNRIQWFVMKAADHEYHIAFEQGFLNGGYYPYERALEMVSRETDREVLKRAYDIYISATDK